MRTYLTALGQVLAVIALPSMAMIASVFLIIHPPVSRVVEWIVGIGAVVASCILEVFCINYVNRRWP
jgi:hypothetical protein